MKTLNEKIEEFGRTRSIALACEIADQLYDWQFINNYIIIAIDGDMKVEKLLDRIIEKVGEL